MLVFKTLSGDKEITDKEIKKAAFYRLQYSALSRSDNIIFFIVSCFELISSSSIPRDLMTSFTSQCKAYMTC